MSFSYLESLPRDLDWARLWLGDTNSQQPLLDDETIQTQLDQVAIPANEEPTDEQKRAALLRGTAMVAEAIAAKFARDVDITMTDGQRAVLSQRYMQYMALAKTLRSQARNLTPVRAERW